MARLGAILEQARSKFASSGTALIHSLESAATGALPKTVATSIALAITPMVRQELVAAYKKSGLRVETGELLEAVEQAEVFITPSRLVVTLPRHKSKQFYRMANALQHGAIHGKHGARLSKAARRAILTTPGAGSTTRAWHFFQLDTGAIARIQARYKELLKAKGY